MVHIGLTLQQKLADISENGKSNKQETTNTLLKIKLIYLLKIYTPILPMALKGSYKERRHAILILVVHTGSFLQQNIHHLE